MDDWTYRIPHDDPAKPKPPRRPQGQRDDPDFRTDEEEPEPEKESEE